jgi:hypothetical protein
MLVFVASGIVQQSAGREAENANQSQQWEAAAWFLGPWLRISALILGRVGQTGCGAIDDFDTKAAPELAGFFGLGRRRTTQSGQNIPRQAPAGLTVGTSAFIDVAVLVQGKKRLDLPDDLTAGAIGVEDLVEEPKESASDAKDSFSAVGSLIGLCQQSRWQEAVKELVQLGEALLAQLEDALAHGSQAGSPEREERSMHGTKK